MISYLVEITVLYLKSFESMANQLSNKNSCNFLPLDQCRANVCRLRSNHYLLGPNSIWRRKPRKSLFAAITLYFTGRITGIQKFLWQFFLQNLKVKTHYYFLDHDFHACSDYSMQNTRIGKLLHII